MLTVALMVQVSDSAANTALSGSEKSSSGGVGGAAGFGPPCEAERGEALLPGPFADSGWRLACALPAAVAAVAELEGLGPV